MKLSGSKYLSVLLLIGLPCYLSQAEPGPKQLEESLEMSAFLNKMGEAGYKQATGGRPFKLVDRKADLALLKRIADRLARVMGHDEYKHPIAIVEHPNPKYKSMVNAMTFPSGHILFMTGMLDACQKRATELAAEINTLNKKLGKSAVQHHYEGLLAAVMGHEQAHYYYKHTLRAMQRHDATLAGQQNTMSVKQIRFNQKHELESDQYAVLTLKKAGYDPVYAVEILKIIKASSGSGVNVYLNSHPGSNERLALLLEGKTEGQHFLRLDALEQAFASIETGTELNRARETLEKELLKQPDNPFLLLAQAKIYHRLWEQSCRVEQLVFKTAITTNYFRDEMLQAKGPNMRSMSMIPGNREYYDKSLAYYEQVTPVIDPVSASAYAALKSYDSSQLKSAVHIATQLQKYIRKPQKPADVQAIAPLLNNLAIVYYFAGSKQASYEFFETASFYNVRLFQALLRAGSQGKIAVRNNIILHKSNQKNTGTLYESVFNLGQLLYLQSKQAKQPEDAKKYLTKAKTVWGAYLQRMDNESDWATYAARELQVDLAKMKPEPLPVLNGITPGQTINALATRWGKPAKKNSLYYGVIEEWQYPDKHASFHIRQGTLLRMILRHKDSGKFSNGLIVGMKRKDVIKLLGKPLAESQNKAIYAQGRMLLMYSDAGQIQEIMLRAR